MDTGVAMFPTHDAIAPAEMARLAEQRGHESLFFPEHTHIPASRETAWLALAMSSTFAGNLTVLGSMANLIVVENAQREGITVSFWEYCKVGVPLTLLTLVLGIAWLQYVRY